MRTDNSTTAPARPNARPLTLSADKRQISYRSKSGKVLTLQLTNSTAKAADSEVQFKSSKPIAKVNFANLPKIKPEESKGYLPDLFDSISFWCMEAVEVACFGPYDEVAAK